MPPKRKNEEIAEGSQSNPIDLDRTPNKKTKNSEQALKAHQKMLEQHAKQVVKEEKARIKAEKERIKTEKLRIKLEKERRTMLPPEARIHLSSNMQARVQRALEQKMFVLSRQVAENDSSVETFEVLGSIGNNYTVTFASKMKCTCIDHSLRRQHCKHILMILLRVYRLPFDSPFFQKLTTKKQDRLSARSQGQQIDPSILVPEEAKERIMKIMNGEEEASGKAERRPLDTSDCPVCFEEFEQAEIETIDFCKLCGNNIHKACFTMWASSQGNKATCVYCRAEWMNENELKKKEIKLDSVHNIEHNYANFAQELGLATKRDTSTYQSNGYYHRPYEDESYTRFMNQGYNDEDDDDDDDEDDDDEY